MEWIKIKEESVFIEDSYYLMFNENNDERRIFYYSDESFQDDDGYWYNLIDMLDFTHFTLIDFNTND